MSDLFNKHGRPNLAGMSENDAWAACEDYEDHVYDVGESFSEGEWDWLIADVRAVYNEYYARFES